MASRPASTPLHRRLVPTALLLLLAVVFQSQQAMPAAAVNITAGDLLASLTVRAENGTGYDRTLFPHWVDADGDTCDTREEVLIAESTTTPPTGAGCKVLSGTWNSWYDGATWTNPSDVDIDHVVALKEAWDSGAHAWTTAKRQRYANDLGYAWSLDAVTDNVNQSKSDKDPAQWLPPLASARCAYAIHWTAVKYRWNLALDTTEKSALASILTGSCGSTSIPTPPLGT
ncbi:HNH endonuclease family protein [Kribbella sp. CA-293567]|uniref:HNH endonuclease family protein n=1 Tax=Kribbella sp. CA-293567 TaxID=3002436 RepID=UPI0022DCEA87|nr:HNH endonuclease family protein [Kribbella sp. CA-293567]WBQ07905.1 HNH endonuclease family protein [Kribbella sp. CA-293567]